jgi:hypothetical protein
LGLARPTQSDLVANRFYFANGLQQTILSTKGREQPLVLDHEAVVTSEVIHKGDLFAIFDYSVSWREPELTFEAFLQKRAQIKSDWYTLGVEFLDKQFEPLPHQGWANFLPRFMPTLKPGYSQADMGAWLAQQEAIPEDAIQVGKLYKFNNGEHHFLRKKLAPRTGPRPRKNTNPDEAPLEPGNSQLIAPSTAPSPVMGRGAHNVPAAPPEKTPEPILEPEREARIQDEAPIGETVLGRAFRLGLAKLVKT